MSDKVLDWPRGLERWEDGKKAAMRLKVMQNTSLLQRLQWITYDDGDQGERCVTSNDGHRDLVMSWLKKKSSKKSVTFHSRYLTVRLWVHNNHAF